MDHVTLKKKLSSYVSEGGYLRNVSEEVLYEVLVAWENWTGSAKEFYRALGFSQKKMACLIGKAKKLKRDGHFGEADFKAVVVDGAAPAEGSAGGDRGCAVAEVVCSDGRRIRFSHVDGLIDFLKRSA